jgi:hypothetical protein
MVGKINKKKQIISRFDRSLDAVSIDLSEFVTIGTELPEWNDFLAELCQSPVSKEEQVQIITSKRKKFRSLILDATQEETTRLCLMKNIVIFYLNPIYFPFHTCFEWILSCMNEMMSDCTFVISSIREICSSLWNTFSSELQIQNELFTAQKWMVTLSSMTVLDRDFSWLSVNDKHSLNLKTVLGVHQKLLTFLLSTDSLSCVTVTNEKTEGNVTNNEIVKLAKESIQRLSLYIELIRNIYILLKVHWNGLHLSCFIEDQEWLLSLHECFSVCLYLLAVSSGDTSSSNALNNSDSSDNQQLSSKDLMNSCGSTMIILCFYFWKIDQKRNSADTILVSQFESFVLSLTSLDQFSSVLFGSFLVGVPMTYQSSSISHFSFIARAALIRGIITLADPQNTFFPASILLSESLTEFLLFCSSKGESFDQLFNLQSIEVWLNQLSTVLTKETTEEMVKSSENYLIMSLRIMKLIKASWNHPNRQVSNSLMSFSSYYCASCFSFLSLVSLDKSYDA